MLKKLISHTVIYGLAPYVIKLVSLFILPIITKDLTALDYGVAGLVSGYVGIFAVLGTLGLPIILSNSFIKHEKNYTLIWRHIYGFLSIWNVIYGFLISAILFLLLNSVVSDENLLLVIFCSVGPIIFFGPTQSIGSLFYQLNKKPIQVVWRSIFFGILAILLNLYFISHLKMGYLGWFFSDFIVGVLFNVSYWWALNVKYKLNPIYRFRWKSILKYLKISLPIIPHQYANFFLRSSDRAVMGFLKVPSNQIGLYSLSSNFGNYFYSITSAFSTAANPFILNDLKRNNVFRVRSVIYLLQIIILFGTFIFSLWSKEILLILIKNEELYSIYPLVIIIVMAFSYRPMYLASSSVLFFKEKTKELLKVTFVAGFFNVSLNTIFIPIFGFEFAAYSTFACYMYVGYSGFFLKSFIMNKGAVSFYPLLWLFITLTLTTLACFAVELSYVSKIIISIIVLFISLFSIYLIKSKWGFDEK